MPFNTNIFINCPFDKKYRKLLEPLLFSCIYAGLEPKISILEDSGTIRLKEIINLIKISKYSIHDLSRMKSSKPNELARFNMPFELGLDLGIRETSSKLKDKKCLILDVERYRYQAALSDLGGSDIFSYGHKNQVVNIIHRVRDWFATVISPVQSSSSHLYQEYTEFVSDLQINLLALNYNKSDIENLTISEFIYYAKTWISSR